MEKKWVPGTTPCTTHIHIYKIHTHTNIYTHIQTYIHI